MESRWGSWGAGALDDGDRWGRRGSIRDTYLIEIARAWTATITKEVKNTKTEKMCPLNTTRGNDGECTSLVQHWRGKTFSILSAVCCQIWWLASAACLSHRVCERTHSLPVIDAGCLWPFSFWRLAAHTQQSIAVSCKLGISTVCVIGTIRAQLCFWAVQNTTPVHHLQADGEYIGKNCKQS